MDEDRISDLLDDIDELTEWLGLEETSEKAGAPSVASSYVDFGFGLGCIARQHELTRGEVEELLIARAVEVKEEMKTAWMQDLMDRAYLNPN